MDEKAFNDDAAWGTSGSKYFTNLTMDGSSKLPLELELKIKEGNKKYSVI